MSKFRRFTVDLFALTLLTALGGLAVCVASFHPADPPATLVFPPPEATVNAAGKVGALIAHHCFETLGMSIWVAVGGLLCWDLALFFRQKRPGLLAPLLGIALLTVGSAIAIQKYRPELAQVSLKGSGGLVGVWGLTLFEGYTSEAGVIVLIGTVLLAGLVLISDSSMVQSFFNVVLLPVYLITLPFRWLLSTSAEQTGQMFAQPEPAATPAPVPEPIPALPPAPAPIPVNAPSPIPVKAYAPPAPAKLHEEEDDDEEFETEIRIPLRFTQPREPVRVNPPAATVPARPHIRPVGDPQYRLPNIALLEKGEEFPYELLAAKAQTTAALLEGAFQDFGLNVRVTEVDTGPVITQFELELEKGLRVSKVTALADDLAVALRVPSVRVVASIPGKNTVGVEVPNEKQVMVRLRDLIETAGEGEKNFKLPLFIGKNVSGHPMVIDMTKMPHLLIAGRTGTGKSVCLNALILSILMTRTPEQVKMLMIDPKMVELSPYKRVPHLMHPVITDMKQAEAALAWAVEQMEERYDLLARVGVRHLDGYNKLSREQILERLEMTEFHEEAANVPHSMPYIVIVADEMADMMMTSGKDVEGYIIRLAQKSRAVGIHLVLATQKPTVDVITGLIKSNLPARISFQVSSKSDSRVVLDESGADKLLGCGDMLYLAPGTSKLSRGQGTYVSDEEVEDIIDFYNDQEPQYDERLMEIIASSGTTRSGGSSGSGGGTPGNAGSQDELYAAAVEVILREGRGSVSLLQRHLGIGYGRAARLIDYMAEDGLVGEYNGSQAREVLYSLDEWQTSR